ncbi:DUF6415 family natural product biosynthesis protein [Streptomyces sp. NBC_00390]|uniref:DUF6415 family natural product biosynthesis protein n=1 Tax=Streptomyces sp. NBC_00390 TaxID=2975736 RepID=UPI002E1C2B0E
MKQGTAPQTSAAAEGHDPRPVDIATMRGTAQRVLALGEAPPLREDLDQLADTLRGHLNVLVPEIRNRVNQLPAMDPAACVARIGVDEAWRRLHTTTGFGPDAAYRQAERLARSVRSLCDHYENLHPPTIPGTTPMATEPG